MREDTSPKFQGDEKLTAEVLIWGYKNGLFPMANGVGGAIQWFGPDPRAVLPLNRFHVSRSLRRRVQSNTFHVTVDQCFTRVMQCCAEVMPDRRETWISPRMIDAYSTLHGMGFAHSIEAWTNNLCRELVGGLYGVVLGSAFFGESMFSRVTDASKVCLVHLVEHLRFQGFTLLDTQFTNPHLEQFGVVVIPRSDYLVKLQKALSVSINW